MFPDIFVVLYNRVNVYLLSSCFQQTHQGAATGTISNPGDMDAFKRQQAMVQAGRGGIVKPRLLCCFVSSPFALFFCLSVVFLFPPLPLIASAYRYLASSTSALCWSLNPRKERWPVRSAEGHRSLLSAFVLRYAGIVCLESQIRLRGPGLKLVAMGWFSSILV